MSAQRLDGNAAGGILGSVFPFEMTRSRSTCATCGAEGEVGRLHAYMRAPGTVLRCPGCGSVLMRIVEIRGDYVVDLSGLRSLRIRGA